MAIRGDSHTQSVILLSPFSLPFPSLLLYSRQEDLKLLEIKNIQEDIEVQEVLEIQEVLEVQEVCEVIKIASLQCIGSQGRAILLKECI